jgi:hypothetical protein
MFEEIDLQIADTKAQEAPALITRYACSFYQCSGNRCSNSSCAGTSGKYCC